MHPFRDLPSLPYVPLISFLISYLMTVIRSQAFQNARKSTGQNTYYRRKGVQLVRSKATFAPGRTFTTPQQLQQFYMKFAQYCIKTGDGENSLSNFVDFMNVTSNKRYNASTQINRLVSGILKGIKDQARFTAFTPTDDLEDCWNEKSRQIFRHISIGDWYFEPLATGCYETGSGAGADSSWNYYINLKVDQSSLTDVLNKINRKLRRKTPLTEANFACGGIVFNYTGTFNDMQEPRVLPFRMLDYENGIFTYHYMGNRLQVPSPEYPAATYLCFCIVSDYDSGIPLSKALMCTPMIYMGAIPEQQ